MRHGISRLLLFSGLLGLSLSLVQAQPGGPRGFGRNRAQWAEPGSILPELAKPDFLTELNFSDEQRNQLEALRKEFGPLLFGGGSDDERKKNIKAFETKCLDLLNDEQQKLWETKKAAILAKAKEAAPATPAATPAAPANPAPKRGPRKEAPVPEGSAPVVSFDVEGRTPRDAADGGPKLAFNFQFAPWTDVLELFAKTADLTLDLDDTPPGTFTYRDSRSYTPTQALDVLNGYLLPRGYLLVRRDRFLVCLSIADGIPPNLAPQISLDELPERGKNELVSLVIPVRGMQADQIVGEVRELLGPQGKASALKNTNSIVVTDIGSHVRRIHALLSAESAVDTRDTAFKAIPLKHISANEAERMVRRLFGLNATMNMASAVPPQFAGQQPQPGFNWWERGGRRRDRDRDGEQEQQPNQPNQPAQPNPAPPAPTAQSGSQFANKIQVAADVRTNQLLVTASAALIKVVEDAVQTLDTDVDAAGNPVRRNDVPLTLKTHTITGGDVATIAQTINQLVPGVVLGHDARSGKLHIQATPDEHDEVAGLIQELGSEGSSSVAVIHLQKMDPVALANTLLSLYSRDGARAPTVEPDPLGRRLIIRGTPDQLQQMKTILAQLGEGEGAARDKSNRGGIRSLTLGGRDPEELLPLLKDAWSASRPNPIRIKVPSRPKPIRERSVPGANRGEKSPEGPLGENDAPADALIRPAAFVTEAESDDANTEATEKPEEDADEEQPALPNASAPVGVQVIGDQLIISSSDPAALDTLEELYERISATMPPRTKWTVFYLRSADATEAAQMVERLFPQSNVSMTSTGSSSGGVLGSLTGGLNTIGRGLMNVSGLNQTLSAAQTLRIVTDIRSNALYVTGPADQIAEVEQILEVLDASDVPPSLRDRLPREIAVEHADVEEVAEVVEAVFKDAMTPENQIPGQRGGGFNPLMMLMGGGAPQQGGRRQPSVQLSVGVDRRTNHLIVSCSDALFQQIETLVQGIDERAKAARQTVRVVKLEQADPTLVQQTLGSLMTKVTVGTTRRSRRPANANSGSPAAPAGTSGGANANPPVPGGGNDAMRDAFLQRMMMDRMNRGGGGGGGGFGGGRRPEP